jgi:hypothetical protein
MSKRPSWLGARFTIKWKRQWGGEDRIVWVSVAKLEDWWKAEGTDYHFVRGQGRPDAYRIIRERVERGEILPMAHLGFHFDNPMRIGFTDGRHRFAWVRDHGGIAVPVTFDRAQAVRARRIFGTKSRVCRVVL